MPNYLDRARAIHDAIEAMPDDLGATEEKVRKRLEKYRVSRIHVDEDPRWKCPYCGAYTTGDVCTHCTAPREVR